MYKLLLMIGAVVGCTSKDVTSEDGLDRDGDLATVELDCDDDNASAHPWHNEECDGIDNDCDGNIDEGLTKTYLIDRDNDSFAGPESIESCDDEPPSGYLSMSWGDDCDDTDPYTSPGQFELCWDGVDNDCDSIVDESKYCMKSLVYGVSEEMSFGRGFGRPADLNGDSVAELVVVSGNGDTMIWYTAPEMKGYADSADSIVSYPAYYLNTNQYENATNQRSVVALERGDGTLPDMAFGYTGTVDGPAGAVLVTPSSVLQGEVELLDVASAVLQEYGEQGAFGATLASVKGWGEEGAEALLVGAFAEHSGDVSDAGAAYLFPGPVEDSIDADAAWMRVYGEGEGDNLGWDVNSADFDADGLPELAISMPQFNVMEPKPVLLGTGGVLIYDTISSGNMNIDDSIGRVFSSHTDYRQHLGAAIEVADMNTDGYDDIVVSAPEKDTIYLLAGPLIGNIDVATSAIATLHADDFTNSTGSNMEIFDYNDDASFDLLFNNHTGGHYILSGPFDGVVEIALAADNLLLRSNAMLVNQLGDIDGDGVVDIAVAIDSYSDYWLDGDRFLGVVGILGHGF